MKAISFKVAKAIKEAGYPQGNTPYQYVSKNYDTFIEGEVIDSFYENWVDNNVVDIPYVMEVWLWLWREKNIQIKLEFDSVYIWPIGINVGKFNDPEEAIIAGIEHLVDNDLIK